MKTMESNIYSQIQRDSFSLLLQEDQSSSTIVGTNDFYSYYQILPAASDKMKYSADVSSNIRYPPGCIVECCTPTPAGLSVYGRVIEVRLDLNDRKKTYYCLEECTAAAACSTEEKSSSIEYAADIFHPDVKDALLKEASSALKQCQQQQDSLFWYAEESDLQFARGTPVWASLPTATANAANPKNLLSWISGVILGRCPSPLQLEDHIFYSIQQDDTETTYPLIPVHLIRYRPRGGYSMFPPTAKTEEIILKDPTTMDLFDKLVISSEKDNTYCVVDNNVAVEQQQVPNACIAAKEPMVENSLPLLTTKEYTAPPSDSMVSGDKNKATKVVARRPLKRSSSPTSHKKLKLAVKTDPEEAVPSSGKTNKKGAAAAEGNPRDKYHATTADLLAKSTATPTPKDSRRDWSCQSSEELPRSKKRTFETFAAESSFGQLVCRQDRDKLSERLCGSETSIKMANKEDTRPKKKFKHGNEAIVLHSDSHSHNPGTKSTNIQTKRHPHKPIKENHKTPMRNEGLLASFIDTINKGNEGSRTCKKEDRHRNKEYNGSPPRRETAVRERVPVAKDAARRAALGRIPKKTVTPSSSNLLTTYRPDSGCNSERVSSTHVTRNVNPYHGRPDGTIIIPDFVSEKDIIHSLINKAKALTAKFKCWYHVNVQGRQVEIHGCNKNAIVGLETAIINESHPHDNQRRLLYELGRLNPHNHDSKGTTVQEQPIQQEGTNRVHNSSYLKWMDLIDIPTTDEMQKACDHLMFDFGLLGDDFSCKVFAYNSRVNRHPYIFIEGDELYSVKQCKKKIEEMFINETPDHSLL